MAEPPDLPFFSGIVERDFDLLVRYISDLVDYLNTQALPIGTWTTTGTATDRALTSGDTLSATQDVLGTLITDLKSKGILT